MAPPTPHGSTHHGGAGYAKVGRIFHALQHEARAIRRGAAHSAHAARIARDAHVYLDWMLPRVDAALDLDAPRPVQSSSPRPAPTSPAS